MIHVATCEVLLMLLMCIMGCKCSEGTTIDAEPEFAEAIPNISVPLGQDFQLPCKVDNLGTYRVAWINYQTKSVLTIHHHTITQNPRISVRKIDNRNFVLHIRNVKRTDSGGYMCQINTTPMKHQIGYVDVLVPPSIITEESSRNITAREGTNVSLLCKANGNPSPNITWQKEDSQPIPLGMRDGKELLATRFEGNELNIRNVSRLHIGTYLCMASNGVLPSASRRIFLDVSYEKNRAFEEAVGTHQDPTQTANEKRNASGIDKVHEIKSGASVTSSLWIIPYGILMFFFILGT